MSAVLDISKNPTRGFRVLGEFDWLELNDFDASARVKTRINEDAPFLLELELESGRNIIGLSVDGKKNTVLRRTLEQPDGSRRIITRVGTTRTASGVLYAPYPQNMINILEVFEDGQAVVWEAALVSQRGCFYITVQRKYNFRCYRDDEGRLTCPAFEKWPSMVGRIVEFTMDKVASFLSVAEYAAAPEPNVVGLASGQGRVLWYNLAQGFGAVILADGRMARVHWSNVEVDDQNEFVRLEAGEVVEFDPELLHLKSGGSFQWEVRKVRLVK